MRYTLGALVTFLLMVVASSLANPQPILNHYDSSWTYQSWGPSYPLHNPLSAGTWTLGGTTPTTSGTPNSNCLQLELNASGNNVAYWSKTVPTAPYTITAILTATGQDWLTLSSSNGYSFIGWRNSSNGKLLTCGANALYAGVFEWTNNTTYAGTPANVEMYPPVGLIFERLTDDGTNRHFYVSANGVHWNSVWSTANTTWLTSDTVICGVYNDVTTNNCGINVLSWKENTSSALTDGADW
jgi:hypothetical protein